MSAEHIIVQKEIASMSIIKTGITFLALASLSNITQAALPPTLSNPDASPEPHLGAPFLGELTGLASVSAAGNAAYSLPLQLPPGTASMSPQLTLGYNSNIKNGLLGLGWFMGGADSAITRCPQNLAQDGRIRAVKNDRTDRFCLDGRRLVAVNGEYGESGAEYRTEIDSLRRITSYGIAAGSNSGPEYFTVESADGRISHYGATQDSRIEAQGMSKVATWALNKVSDAFDNYYRIEYSESSNQGSFRPKTIFYTGNDSQGLDPYVRVTFQYEDRPDQPFFFRGGAKVKEYKKRLQSISIEIDNQAVGQYRLGYEEFGVNSTNSPSGNQSRLISIERCDGNSTCQKPLRLAWWADEQGTPVSHYDLIVPADTDEQHQAWRYPRWHDLNGDGTADYIYSVQSEAGPDDPLIAGVFEVMLSGPQGWSTSTWETPEISPHRDFDSIIWADINGDGRTDMITPRLSGSSQREFGIAFSNGNGFDVEYWDGYRLEGDSRKHYFYDMNGDGRLDLVVKEWSREYLNYYNCNGDEAYGYDYTYSVKVGLNTGAQFNVPQPWIENIGKNADLADMDGDGLIDFIAETRYVYFNDGQSFLAPAKDFKSHGAGDCNNPFTYSAVFYDFNADGLTDRYKADKVQYNNGRSFENAWAPQMLPLADLNGDGKNDSFFRSLSGVLNHPKIAQVSLVYMRDNFGGHSRTKNLADDENLNHFQQLADVDGDGILEYTANVTWYCLPSTSHQLRQWCETDRIRVYHSDNPPARLLRSITSGLGHTTEFEYSFLSNHDIYKKYDDATLPMVDVQDSTPVVARFTQSDGAGGLITKRYRYEGLKRDKSGRGLLGFAKISEENLTADSTMLTYFSQQFPYASQPVLVEEYQTSSGTLLSSTQTEYGSLGVVADGPILPYLKESRSTVFDLLDGSALSTTQGSSSVDGYGNIVERVTEVTDHVEQSVHQTRVTNTYDTDESNWHIRQLKSTTIRHSLDGAENTALERHTEFSYSPETGALTESRQEPGKGIGLEFTRTMLYDAFGNVREQSLQGPSLDPRTSTVQFDVRGRFPLLQRNPLQHETAQTWDEFHGGLLTQIDVNGLVSHWRYDTFGRQLQETRPDGTGTGIAWRLADSSTVSDAVIYKQTTTTGVPTKREFFDLLGRLLRSRTQSFDGSYLNIDTQYDSRGRHHRISMPYADGASIVWNTTTYDHLNRIALYEAADSTGTYEKRYEANSTFHTDSRFRLTRQRTNALGQIVAVHDASGSLTRFSYDAAGNQIRVDANAGSNSTGPVLYAYDRLGRVLSRSDPDHGVYTYSYNALGQKLSTRSPELAAVGAAVQYQYDLLGRQVTRTEPEGQSSWIFDDTSDGSLAVGKLTRETLGGLSRHYHYASSGFGRITDVSTRIDTFTYDQAYSYNDNGKPLTVTYPSGFTVENAYNSLGYLERLQAPGGSEVYYQLLAVNSLGHTTQEWKGDGSIKDIAYDESSTRISASKTVIGENTVQNFAYQYDNIGSMTSREDLLGGLSEDFSYDIMDRLDSSHVSGATATNLDFDDSGNITRKSDIADSLAYTGSAPHAVTQLQFHNGVLSQLSYNLNGNFVTSNDGPSVTWSSYNKPLRVVQGFTQYLFEYGPDRKRFKKHHGEQRTHYVGADYEKIFHGYVWGERHYVKVNGRPVMLRQTFLGFATNMFVHTDHLGSITALATSAGEVVQRFSYDAWGKRRGAQDWQSSNVSATGIRGYTGHEHMDDVGLIHMNGRLYSPLLGRMLSPDPVTQAPNDGQNYNRYSYVFNNPLKFSDPSGNICFAAASGYDALGIYHVNRSCSSFSGTAPISGVFGSFRGIVSGPRRTSVINRNLAFGYSRAFRRVRRGVLSAVGDLIDSVGNPYNAVLPTGLLTNSSLLQQLFDYGGNLTGIEQNIVDEILNGRQPDRVYITGHRIGELGPTHTAIEFTNASGQQTTLSAGPSGGSLVSDINRPSDAPGANFTIGYISLPQGVSAAQYANTLLAADAAYCDCLDYDLLPGLQNGFNSNSYIAGLIAATGGSFSASTRYHIGANRPLPARFFRRKR
jgi:RHS repeat-associated protein